MASTSSSFRPTSYRQFYVFLSHRGPDVKNTLASHIYHALDRYEVSVFQDKYEMERGEQIPAQIEDAIRNASFHIPIFSKGYADSRWCLDELCSIMETPAKILPVFYDVEPSDLSSRDGLYAKALQTLGEQKGDAGTPKYDPQTIQKWKKALSDIRIRSGLELEAFNGDEGLLVKNIVHEVLEHVKRTPLPHDGLDHPIGLNEQALDFEEKMLTHTASNVHVVGIVGMGGSGKTTLATHIFNTKRSRYNKTCRLLDVRSSSSLTDLQSKLLSDLTGLSDKICSVSAGREILKGRVRSSCQALIMLDDIDHVHQVDALLVVKDVLRSGSLILVTSRDKQLLERSQISSIYDIRLLNEENAQTLFCWHAFVRSSPLEGYEDLVKEFLRVCSGLPLSLKVFGALLRGHDNDRGYWERQLGRISEILDEHDIKGKLRVSYDALGSNVKEMFLDTACFFIGVDKSSAVRIWEGCGWKGSDGFETLQKRCLVGLDEYNYVTMHDHLRDLGRDVAEEDPSKPRRLYRPDDINDLLDRRDRTEQAVRGIRCTNASLEVGDYVGDYRMNVIDRWKRWIKVVGNFVEFWCHRDIRRSYMSGLQLLEVEGDSFGGIWGHRLRDLLWLRWHRCPFRIFPPWISMNKLRVLELSGGDFESLWSPCHNQIPIQLRELTVTGNLAKIPNSVGALQHLEKLVLRGSRGIKFLPDEFCGLHSLRHLALTGCTPLRSLPEGLGKLTNLQYVDLSRCANLRRLPKSFSRLTQLRHLVLRHCSRLMIEEEILGDISTLEHVDFTRCKKLTVLPSAIPRQPFLKTIDLSWTGLMELPDEIGELNYLRKLVLHGGLKSLPPSIWKLNGLTTLQISNCEELNSLPETDVGEEYLEGIGNLKNLEILEITYCPLRNVPPFTKALLKVTDLKEPARMLDNLTSLTLIRTEISNIRLTEDVCPNLRELRLEDNGHLVEVEVSLPTLETLRLEGCEVLKRITGLFLLPKLLGLNISKCGQLEDLLDVQTMSCLKDLNVRGCPKLKAIRGAAHLRSLETLTAGGCLELESIVGLEQLERLQRLEILTGNLAIWHSIEFLKRMASYKLSSATLGTRAMGGTKNVVETILNSVSFPLKLFKSFTRGDYSISFELPNNLIEPCSCGILCFLSRVPCRGDDIEIWNGLCRWDAIYFCGDEMKGEEWITAMFFRANRFPWRGRNVNVCYRCRKAEVKKGWMVIESDGESNILQVWSELIAHIFCNSSLCPINDHREDALSVA